MDDQSVLDGMSEGEKADYLAFRERVRDTNISEQTLLATDYLNHFNEIVMTLEMIPSMPELLEEAKEWHPKTYVEHVAESTFSDRDLAVEAYAHVPTKYREPFETTIAQMDRLVAASLERIERELGNGDMTLVQVTASAASQMLQRLMDHASGIIHGSQKTMDQGEIDNFLA